MLAWDALASLDQSSPDNYKVCLEDLGYRNILVEDATEQTWRSWIRQLIHQAEVNGAAVPHMKLHDPNRSSVVAYDVLVSVKK